MRVSQSQSAAIGRHIKNADGSDMHASDKAAYDKEFAQLKARATSAQDRAAIARITAARATWGALDQKVIDLWTSGDKRGAVALANGAANTAGDNLSTALDNYATHLKAAAERAKASGERQAEVLMGIFIAIAVALALGIAVLLTRRIAGGLKPVQARLNSLAENCLTDTERALTAMANEGDLTIEVVAVTTPAEVSGTDEIAQIAGTFNMMLEKAQSSIEAYNAMRQKRVEFADWAFSSIMLNVPAICAISSVPLTSAGVVTATTSIVRSASLAIAVSARSVSVRQFSARLLRRAWTGFSPPAIRRVRSTAMPSAGATAIAMKMPISTSA